MCTLQSVTDPVLDSPIILINSCFLSISFKYIYDNRVQLREHYELKKPITKTKKQNDFSIIEHRCKFSLSLFETQRGEFCSAKQHLFGGTVLPSYLLFGGAAVPPRYVLFGGTVLPSYGLFRGTTPPNSFSQI